MPEGRLKSVVKRAGNVLVILSVFFLIRRLTRFDIDYRAIFSAHVIRDLVLLAIAFSALIYFQYLPWQGLISAMIQRKAEAAPVSRVFLKANMMKYIPGNVFQYVGRAELVSVSDDVRMPAIVGSVFLESVALSLATVLLGLWGATDYTASLFRNNRIIYVILLCVIAAGVCVLIFREKIGHLLNEKGIVLSWKIAAATLGAVIFFVITFFLQGLILIQITSSIFQASYWAMTRTICGAFAIGWLAGYLMPGASGGIGVRELVLSTLLEGAVGQETIIVSVMVFRILNIIADAAAFAVSQCLYAYRVRHAGGQEKAG